jgi:probable rRNA maturation factor
MINKENINVTVDFNNEIENLDLSHYYSLLKQIVKCAIENEKEKDAKNYEVAITFVGDEMIKTLNNQFRNIDKVTDVLSFPQYDHINDIFFSDINVPILLGDIIINYHRCVIQAEEYNHSIKREIAYLTLHGVLHLLGYDHINNDDKKMMRKTEEKILKKINIPR